MGESVTPNKLVETLKIYGYNVFKIIDFYDGERTKIYMAFIYFKTDEELKQLSDSEKEDIKSIIIEHLEAAGVIPYEIEITTFYFDTDENVQKHYGGNYFYATR